MIRHDPPPGYPVSSYCRACGRDFAADTYFDRHRVGVYDYDYWEGLRRDPPVEDGRRCMTDDELAAAGLRPMTDDETQASGRHRCRSGYGVELWFHPAKAERLRAAHRPDARRAIPAGANPQDASGGVSKGESLSGAQMTLAGAGAWEMPAA